MTQIPIQKETIDRIAAANKIQNPGKASIREMRKMIQDVEFFWLKNVFLRILFMN